jgi:hypothetical protein
MEWVAMRLLAEGHRMKDVAGKLGISIRTVETYRARLMLKLGIDTLPGLVKFAIRAGIITPGPWRSRRCRFRDEPVQLPSTFSCRDNAILHPAYVMSQRVLLARQLRARAVFSVLQEERNHDF